MTFIATYTIPNSKALVYQLGEHEVSRVVEAMGSAAICSQMASSVIEDELRGMGLEFDVLNYSETYSR